MSILGIIPARFASTRFPGKPLIQINGKTMLQRVYEQSAKAKLLDQIVIATDDQRIADHAKSFGAKVIMTNSNHPSGTDRCFRFAENQKIRAVLPLSAQQHVRETSARRAPGRPAVDCSVPPKRIRCP